MIQTCAMWKTVSSYLTGYSFKETGYKDIRIYFYVSFQGRLKNCL